MQIVHYVDGLDARLGGIVRAVRNMVHCQRRVLDVTLAVRQLHDDGSDPELASDHILQLGGIRIPGGALALSALQRARHIVGRADVLHLHAVWSPASAQLADMARRRGVPVVLSTHGALDPWPLRQKRIKKRAYLYSVGRVTLGDTTLVHATCELEASSIRATAHKDAAVIPLPLDAESYRKAHRGAGADVVVPGAGPSGVSMAFVGRMHEKKRVDRAVGALAAIHARGRSATLTIAGTGASSYESYIRSLVRRLGLDASVNILGFVSAEVRRRVLATADVVVVPSEHENFGFVCFEALAAGTPLVTVPGVMTHQQLRASGAAVVCDGSHDGIADAILRIVDGDADEMGRMGQRWIVAALDLGLLAQSYADLYRSVRDARRPTASVAG